MTNCIKYVKLKRSHNLGFGFSIVGGAGSEYPPVVCDIVKDSPAFISKQLTPGDIILEVNGDDVSSYTTREILNVLKSLPNQVILKLKCDNELRRKISKLHEAPTNSEILRNAVTQSDLDGVRKIVALKATESLRPLINLGSCASLGSKNNVSSVRNASLEEGMTHCRPYNTKEVTNCISSDFSVKMSRSFEQTAFYSYNNSSCNINGSCSTSIPTSPYEVSKCSENAVGDDHISLRSPLSLCSPPPAANDVCDSFVYPSNSSFIRMSRSEDFLQLPEDALCSTNFDSDDNVNSSLNTLLDAAVDDPEFSPRCSTNTHFAFNNERDGAEGDIGRQRVNSCSSAIGRMTPKSPPLSEDESDVESLHSFHFSPKAVDLPSVNRLAKRLYSLDGFKKSDVSKHLSKNNEFGRAVAEEYLRYFDFSGDTLDEALRKFLNQFSLSGETQERERVLVHFSKRFLDCNPGGEFGSQDAVHTLTCALMLLNSDLHNPSIGRKMTAKEFIDNLADLNDGRDFDPLILKHLFGAIKSNPLKWAENGSEETQSAETAKLSAEDGNRIVGDNPFLAPPVGSGFVYKKGYVMRKCCAERNGKRTALGKRSWKMWFCVLQDLVLYLHKDEHGARRAPASQMGQNAVRLHHAVAIRAFDYTKKEHVFRLNTADQAQYLMQTSDSKELQAWIEAINFAAASLSAPPMPGAVGSQRKLQKPLLPCGITRLSLADQFEDHLQRSKNIEFDLSHLREENEKSPKSAVLSSLKEKEMYLAEELMRYQTYVAVLRSKVKESTSVKNTGLSDLKLIGVIGVSPKACPQIDVNELGESGDSLRLVPPPIPERSPQRYEVSRITP